MDLPAIAWAVAKLGIVNKDMMQAVVVALEGSVPGMKEWDLCIVVPDLAGPADPAVFLQCWAYSRLIHLPL